MFTMYIDALLASMANTISTNTGHIYDMLFSKSLATALTAGLAVTQSTCPGYSATNVRQTATGLTADLELTGPACDVYGFDLPSLTLTVQYQTASRLHVIIEDKDQVVYQVPESVFPRPDSTNSVNSKQSDLRFTYTHNPFTFAVSKSNGETLFNTSGSPLIFESQYLYIKTSLPDSPNLYGLGEHSDPFRLNTTNYTRTIWTRDSFGIPTGANLYGAHPLYIDHRGENGTHGVVLVNSNGMEVKINNTNGQTLEYHTLGGVLDFYFVSGSSPVETAQGLSEVVGHPAMIPYSALGTHQCRYGFQDVYDVASMVHNYSEAQIPLETAWTDIDYMENRYIFTLDPDRFPLAKMRELVDYLHAHQQRYTLMVDPATAFNPEKYVPFQHGVSRDVFLKRANGSLYQGVVWPGVTVYPDWFHPNTQGWWNDEFNAFFSADTGVDIDSLWIDMNEASNFCNYPCSDPFGYAKENGFPPKPPPIRESSPIELPEFPSDFQPSNLSKRQPLGQKLGLWGRNLIDPPYQIINGAGSISNKTLDTDLVNFDGTTQYDTHNMYGTMMSAASRKAMLSRRPTDRPLVITRSTFLGAGAYVGHWLGDNLSIWPHYRVSIPQMLAFSSMFQLPMVGSDVCGFGGNTTEFLCARWTMLGAFYPFFRNHNELSSIPQEPYRWPSVAAAARYAIDIRYRLLDYMYTAFYLQTQNGTPNLNPMFYLYPNDSNTFGIEHQFFSGDAILVSPVMGENGTSVKMYLPDDIFYDWNDGWMPVRGNASNVILHDVGFQTIPLHVRGGRIVPLRAESANTTTELRKKPFQIVVATGLDGKAAGSLYLDEGSLLEQPDTSLINFTYADGVFHMVGRYDYTPDVKIMSVIVLGVATAPKVVSMYGQSQESRYDPKRQVLTINTDADLKTDLQVSISW